MRPINSGGFKPNSLEDSIRDEDRHIDVMQGGGYYILENIRVGSDTQTCCDIYMYTSKVHNKELLHKIKTIHEITTHQNKHHNVVTTKTGAKKTSTNHAANPKEAFKTVD